jgi:hypothetical protein
MGRFASALLALPLLCGALLAQSEAPEEAGGETPTGFDLGSMLEPIEIHGSISNRYRLRWSDDDGDDHDLSQRLRLVVGDERAPGLSGNLVGRLTEDLDGRGDPREFELFRSLTDSFDADVNARLFQGYVNIRPEGTGLEQVRVGRQYLYAGDVFLADSIRLSLRPVEEMGGLAVEGFVGIPSHVYESSPDGDFLAGGSLRVEPWESGLFSFHYVHVEDDNRYYGAESNDLFTFSHDQRFGDNLSALLSYQLLNGDTYKVTARGEATVPDLDLLLTAAFMAMPTEQKELVYDLDHYHAAALALQPYWTGDVAGAVGLGELAVLEAGVGWRLLFDDADEGEFNREFARVFTTLSVDELLHETLSGSVTGELYVTDQDDIGALAFELQWRPRDDLRLAAGSDFSLYRFDLLSESERREAQGYYLKALWLPAERIRFDATLRFEHDDFGDYGSFGTGLEFGF